MSCESEKKNRAAVYAECLLHFTAIFTIIAAFVDAYSIVRNVPGALYMLGQLILAMNLPMKVLMIVYITFLFIRICIKDDGEKRRSRPGSGFLAYL